VREIPSGYQPPFKAAGASIRDANDNYVAELSSIHGADRRDSMVAWLVEAANAAWRLQSVDAITGPKTSRDAPDDLSSPEARGWAWGYNQCLIDAASAPPPAPAEPTERSTASPIVGVVTLLRAEIDELAKAAQAVLDHDNKFDLEKTLRDLDLVLKRHRAKKGGAP